MRVSGLGLGASIGLALAACGGLLAVHAAPEKPAGQTAAQISFAPKPKQQTFSATCNLEQGEADTRPDPAWVNASFAHDNCWAPALPARLNGLTASREMVVAYAAAEKRYDAAAGAYQRCIQHFVSARMAEAEQRKQTLAVALVTIENHRVATSQADEKKMSGQVAAAVTQFNAFGSDCPD